MAHPSSREAIVTTLSEKLHPSAIVERVDPHIRELEQLPPLLSQPILGDKPDTVVTMNGIKLQYEALSQAEDRIVRENYAAAAGYAHGDALDVFCYQRGFRLHLASQCKSISITVDSSRPALEAADKNAALNGNDIRMDRSQRVRPAEGLLIRGTAIRHHCCRPARLRKDQEESGNRPRRIQRTATFAH